MKSRLLLSTVLTLAALPALADKNPRTGEELADNQAYTYRMLDSVKSLDPQLISSVEDSDVARGLFEGLYNEDGDGNLVPAGAVSVAVSDDKLTYTFKLRPESKWSDGTPVTAADYVYGWQRLVDPALASEYAYYLELAQVKNAADITAGKKPASDLGIKAIDDHTLEVTLENPIPYFTKMLTNSATFPAPKAAIEKFGADWTKKENIVTNGAYLLTDFVDGEKYVETKNPNYWDAKNVIMSPITALVINDEDAALTRYQAGELDRTDVPAGQYPRLKEAFPNEARSTPYACAYDYIINMAPGKGNEALKDIRVRKALSYAVDRDVIVNNILQGGQTAAYSWTPPAINGYTMPDIDYSHWTQAERNEKAKALLAEAGYGPDHPLQLTLNYNTSDAHKKIAVAIQQMWKQTLGVQLTPNNYEWKVHTDKLISGDFEMARYAWCADYNEASTFLDLYTGYSTNNDGKYENPAYDTLMKDAKGMADPTANYTKAEEILAADMPIIPIYHYAKVDMVRPDIKGLPMHDAMQFWYSKDLYRTK
jgi:oligopeptide transport system substrate-binding protein